MLKALALSLAFTLFSAVPLLAADNIIITYGPLRRSIRIASLETFAQEGTVDSHLRFYLRSLNAEQREEFRRVLLKPVNIDPILLSRFLNSEIGADVLTQVGYGITLPGGRNGKFALRAAIVKAALQPEGLTVVNVLRNLPNDVQLQGEHLLELSRTVDRIVNATRVLTTKMDTLATEAAAANPVDFQNLPDLRQPGSFKFREETITLNDNTSQRSFQVLLYIPERPSRTPVVLISHGLGSQGADFSSLGKHLASYGFFVALPQHIGSDNVRKQKFFNRLNREIFDYSDFVERPRDISTVIDQLEQLNTSQFAGKLDLDNVGIVGHSFGGYTALAVAGAELNPEHLRGVCSNRMRGLNVSLFLQCRALNLSEKDYQFRDPRIKAVIAKNPFTSGVFGRQGLSKIDIPVAFLGGNYDPATPFVLEQVRTFSWLSTQNKYLGLKEGQAHISIDQLDLGIPEVLDMISAIELAESALVDSYVNPISLAFLEVHLLGNDKFKHFLTSAYGEYLSREQNLKFFFIDSSASPALERAFQQL
jgi:predicted dienelactone hydrolase